MPDPENEIPPQPRTPARLQAVLSSASGKRVLLMLHDNRSTMLTLRREEDELVILRAHRRFLQAPESLVENLGDWAGGGKLDREAVRDFIQDNKEAIRNDATPARIPRIHASGRHFQLEELRDYLNGTYLDNRSKAPVTWGRKIRKRSPRNLRLGYYDPMRNVITLSRHLDRSDIPRYMIEYVLFHEMLHEVLGIGTRADGKRDIHGKTFKLMEQTYPFYEKAIAFEKKHWG